MIPTAARKAYSRWIREIVESNHIDVYHLTSGLELDVVFPDPPPRETIVTVYDMIPIILSSEYLNNWHPSVLADYADRINLLRRYAKRIISISQNTKNDLVRLLDIPEARIDVIHLGVHPKFKELHGTVNSPHSRYIVQVGGSDPKKNVNGLIQAYSKLPPKIRASHNLVIDCGEFSKHKTKLNDLCISLGITNNVRYVSSESDDELLNLYRNSSLLVYPSLYEGFGLPPLEAMSLGVPVVASNVASIPEVVGDAALLVDPHDSKDIASKIEAVLTDERLRSELVRRGFERVKLFSWDKCAKDTVGAYHTLYSRQRTKRDYQRYHIAYFSPFNPQAPAVSDYSEALLAELKNHFEIDLFVDKFDSISDELKAFKTYDLSDFDSRNEIYDLAVYHVGNNPLYAGIYRIMLRYPGLLILHDTNLHDLLYHSYVTTESEPLQYIEELALSFDEEGVAEARRVLRGAPPEFQQFPLNRRATLYSKGIVVLTTAAQKELMPEGSARAVHIPMGTTCLYTDIKEAEDKKRKLRSVYGIAADELMISTVGFLSAQRRLEVCLRAFAELRKAIPKVRYYIAGIFLSDSVRTQVFDDIRGLKIESSVVVREFGKDFGKIDDYIAMSDIIVHLRHPNRGTASSTVTRALSHGKPVVLSAIPDFEDYGDEYAWKVNPEHYESILLFNYLCRLCSDPPLRETMGMSALRYARRCGWNNIAGIYADFIRELISDIQER